MMEAFFPGLLDTFLTPAFLEDVRKKFHYEETGRTVFQKVAAEMQPLMRKEAFWENRVFSWKNGQQREDSGAGYECVIMSLGSGLDALQERYTEAGLLSESYMLEVLASELLLKGYNAYNSYVKGSTEYHVARYHFPGGEEAFPLSMLPELLAEGNSPVVCNEAFCLIPKKSVVFVAELTQDASIQCESICIGCGNRCCQNRIDEDSPRGRMIARMADVPLNYGYSRIFGRR